MSLPGRKEPRPTGRAASKLSRGRLIHPKALLPKFLINTYKTRDRCHRSQHLPSINTVLYSLLSHKNLVNTWVWSTQESKCHFIKYCHWALVLPGSRKSDKYLLPAPSSLLFYVNTSGQWKKFTAFQICKHVVCMYACMYVGFYCIGDICIHMYIYRYIDIDIFYMVRFFTCGIILTLNFTAFRF